MKILAYFLSTVLAGTVANAAVPNFKCVSGEISLQTNTTTSKRCGNVIWLVTIDQQGLKTHLAGSATHTAGGVFEQTQFLLSEVGQPAQTAELVVTKQTMVTRSGLGETITTGELTQNGSTTFFECVEKP